MYHKKKADTDTSAYDRVRNVLKNVDTSYNTTMLKMHKPINEGR